MKQETIEEVKDLAYWKVNAEEDYIKVPISVLRYISELEKQQEISYSEEEVLEFANWCRIEDNKHPNRVITIQQLFKQFKKK
jgi:hypothetical protein